MYHPYLPLFIKIAQCGSFSKAAKRLYISSTAVMKKMNRFEEQLGFPLFIRNNRGLQLTEEGKLIYREGLRMIKKSETVLNQARNIHEDKKKILRFGTSFLYSGHDFITFWQSVKEKFPQLTIHIVPLSGEEEVYTVPFSQLWEKIDVVYGNLTDAAIPGTLVQQVGEQDLKIGLSQENPLAKKEKLEIKDLFGQSIVLVQRGYSSYSDNVRDKLENYPQINILDSKAYDYKIINRCINENYLLLMVDAWKDLHPLLDIISVEWSYKMPYGFIYSKNIAESLKSCIQKTSQLLCQRVEE